MSDAIRNFYRVVIIAALLAVGAIIFNFTQSARPPVGTTVPATRAPELNKVPKQDITPPKVAVYKPPAKKKLALPPEVQDDPNKYVLDSTRLPNDTHPHTVTTVIDAHTGEVQTYDRRDPLPWLAAERSNELRLDYGIKRGFDRVGRLSYRVDLLQVKALHAGITAAIDSDGEYFIGVGVGWRW